jgi:hypothetical protein
MRSIAVAAGVGLLALAGGTLLAQQVQDCAQAPRPAQVVTPAADADDFMQGEIVRIDPVTNKVVVRVGPAGALREREFIFAPNARFFGPDDAVIVEGVRARQFRPGVSVRFRMGPRNTGITEFRMVRVPRR